MKRQYYVYMMTNKPCGVIYIGSTSELEKRIDQHKQKVLPNSFTTKYNLSHVVYIEQCDSAELMTSRERNLKNYRRQWKINLIEEQNPLWEDLLNNKN